MTSINQANQLPTLSTSNVPADRKHGVRAHVPRRRLRRSTVGAQLLGTTMTTMSVSLQFEGDRVKNKQHSMEGGRSFRLLDAIRKAPVETYLIVAQGRMLESFKMIVNVFVRDYLGCSGCSSRRDVTAGGERASLGFRPSVAPVSWREGEEISQENFSRLQYPYIGHRAAVSSIKWLGNLPASGLTHGALILTPRQRIIVIKNSRTLVS